MRMLRAIALAAVACGGLSGCTWFLALPAVEQVGLITGTLTGTAALTNADVNAAEAYCKLRGGCGAAAPVPAQPAP
jgi:hypothetical protein